MQDQPSPLARALAARARGDLDAAAAATAEALAASPAHPQPWLVHGSLAHLRGDLSNAITSYRRALGLAPDDAAAHAALAVALTQSHQPRTAHAHFLAACADPSRTRNTWTGLRTLRQAREPGEPRPWNVCATPLFTADTNTIPHVDTPHPLTPGRTVWTADALRTLIKTKHPRIVALTGAGISAASGLLTRKQLWRQFTRDDAVSITKFNQNPQALWTVISEFWGDRSPAPNPAHLALARLPNLLGVVTQNVDDLHQAAAHATGTAAKIHELHGSLLRTRCTACGALGPPATTLARAVTTANHPPPCRCGGHLRPDVVLFGERVPPAELAAAAALVAGADLLLVIGCAMDVSPASELPVIAALAGARIVEIKREPSRLSDIVHVHHIAGPAEQVLPTLGRGPSAPT